MRFIRGIRVPAIADLFSLAFGSVMVSLSNYSYEPSLSSRPAVGKALQEDAPVFETILIKLLAMKSDILWCRSEIEKFGRVPGGRVIADSFMNAPQYLDPDSIDLVVTKDLKRLETENFGKYWQTVREAEPLLLSFEHAELQRLVDRIRSINVERGTYGGRGWANYAVSYFNDTDQFCETLGVVMKPGAHAIVVVGNSILQGVEIPIDNVFADLAGRHGFDTVGIHIVREKRVGASIVSSSVRQGARTTAKLYESAVVLRKS